MTGRLRIGEAAERAAVSVRTLRYYEEHGLVRPRRDANGYRQYDDAELRVVHEIRALLADGFGLDDIKPFVACLRAGNSAGVRRPGDLMLMYGSTMFFVSSLGSAWPESTLGHLGSVLTPLDGASVANPLASLFTRLAKEERRIEYPDSLGAREIADIR